jgi:AraC-like DNA-binding protein
MISVQRHESVLGRWVHAACRPQQLEGLVDSVWYFEGRLVHRRERIFPDGRVELNVHLGAPYGQVTGDRRDEFAATCFSGVLTGTMLLEAPPVETAVIGVRLLPAGAAELLGRPLHELTNFTVDLGDLIGTAAEELFERCSVAIGPEARLRAALHWLEERATVTARQVEDDAVVWAAREIERHHGALSITRLRERTGWSKSRFAAVFRERVGVPPKRLARIIRFRRALELLHRGGLPLTEIALRTGYYDQPHFNSDFHEFTGATPGEYLSAMHYPGSLNTAEG